MNPYFHRMRNVSPMRALCLAALVILPGFSSDAQELSRPATAQASEAELPTPSGSIQASGIQESVQPYKTGKDVPGNTLKAGPFTAQLSFQGSAVYNDNIYIQRTNRTSDFIWTLSPGLMIGAGDYVQQEESWLTVDYAPSFIFFTDNDGNDAIDQHGCLNFEWRPASWTFGLKQDYRQLSGAIIEAGNRVTRSIYDTDFYIKYDLSSKTTFELDGEQSVNDYDLPLFSYNVWTAAGWLDYWVTPKIKLGIGVTGGFMDVVQNPNQTYQQGMFRAEYDMTEKFKLRGSAGGEVREFQGAQKERVNGIFSLGATYKPWENTELIVDAYRRDESSLVTANQNYTLTGFSAGIHQVVAEKYTLGVAGGFNHSTYYATATGVNTNSDFDYFFIRPEIDCRITDQLTAEIFYQYQQNDSSQGIAFNSDLMGINLAYHF